MNAHSLILLIKKIGQITHATLLDLLYIGVIFLLTGGVVIISVSTLIFLLRTFDAVIFASGEETAQSAPSFNITGLRILAPRFGVVVNDLDTPLSSPFYKKEEIPLSTPVISISPPLSGLRLRILNGTSISGLAGTWKKRFEDHGLGGVSVGNAPQRDMKGIMIFYRPEKEIFLKGVRDILESYGSIAIRQESDGSLSNDMVVMIGE